MRTPELIQAAMTRTQITSLRRLAKQLDVSHSIVSLWANDLRVPDFEHAAALAEMAGLPPAKTAAEVRLIATSNSKIHALLKRIANAAIIILATNVYANSPHNYQPCPTDFNSQKAAYYVKYPCVHHRNLAQTQDRLNEPDTSRNTAPVDRARAPVPIPSPAAQPAAPRSHPYIPRPSVTERPNWSPA